MAEYAVNYEFTARVVFFATTTVEADSEEEAIAIVEKSTEDDHIDSVDGYDIVDIEGVDVEDVGLAG